MSNFRRNNRENIRSGHTVLAEIGGLHPVSFEVDETIPVQADGIEIFMGMLETKWSKILPSRPSASSAHDLGYDPQFEIYKNPRSIGMAILEKRYTVGHAREEGIRWNTNDYSRVVNDIESELFWLGLPQYAGDKVDVKLTAVVPIKEPGSRRQERNLTAVVDPKSEIAEILIEEHQIFMNNLQGPLHNFRYPRGKYVPMVNLGRINRSVSSDKFNACIASAQSCLPLTVQLEPLNLLTPKSVVL
jgi:hypothetical protein